MKRLILLPLLLCLSLLQAAAAQWTDENNVTWTFDTGLGWNYGGIYHYFNTITSASGYADEVTIPETVYDGETAYTVGAISGSVFQNNKTLTTVHLPSTVKAISGPVFYGCSALTTINLSNIEFIGDNVFRECSNLSAVDLSNCLWVEYYAFRNCSSLTTIGSLAKCTFIGNEAFAYCTSLTPVDLPDNMTLGDYSFSFCSSLTSIGSLKGATIGSRAFSNCSSLTAVDLSQANLQSLGSGAFEFCRNLQSIGDNTVFEAVADYVFYDCQKLESVNLSNCKAIGNSAFYGCQKLQSVDLSKVKTSGTYAFYGCSSLETVGDISSFTTIPNYLFRGCTKLQNVSLPNVTTVGDCAFQYCQTLTQVNLPQATSIGYGAFSGCTNIETISLPLVETIGGEAFNDCSSLDAPEITSTALTSVGGGAFSTPGTVTLMATTPATLGNSNAFGTLILVRVPDTALAAYRAADVWTDFQARIVGIGTQIDYDVEVSALNDRSTLEAEIGETNLGSVVSLKVTGTINSYDIMVMRNKMDNLHYLDLTDANIVANNYEYYTGYHTEDDVLGGRSFYQLEKLISVKLPKTIKSIGYQAFNNCINMKEVVFQTGLETIEYEAFCGCGNLKTLNLKDGLKTIGSYAFAHNYYNNDYHYPQFEEIILPEGLISIGSYAFRCNTHLKRVAFPSTLETMGSSAFYSCTSLQSISLPTSLKNIPSSAFQYCHSLTEARIPSTITSIGNNAFGGCDNLNDVYTYIAEPTPIEMNTFDQDTYVNAMLHVPTTSKWTYWYNTQWSQFRNSVAFDAEYEYFYINNDFTINDEQGTIHGGAGGDDPDADLNAGSGLIVETENNTQELDEVHIKVDGDGNGGSIIADENLTANKVYFDITVSAGRWYFLSFPFRVLITNIVAPGPYVIRYYNGLGRAQGNGGWMNWLEDALLPGKGYIFYTSKSGTLSLCVEKADMNWKAENRPNELESHPAENQQDASWNFMGNPHTSYYDIDETGYDQPFTVWNGSSYEAVRPGDDAYALEPFEAFFVQKPDNKTEVDFPAGGQNDGRYTKQQWTEAKTAKAAARRERGASTTRQLVNLTLTDGTNGDKTRVVFNEKAQKAYELTCDAAKFLTSEKVPQLYTLDQEGQTRYAINERPMGEVRLGYVAATDGELTIRAMRMDQPLLLRDNELQITHDLSMGDYTFSTTSGINNSRFMLVKDGSATAIGQLREQTGVSVMADEGGISFLGIDGQTVSVYAVNGTRLVNQAANGLLRLPKGTYIVKVDNTTSKVLVR